VFSEYQAPVGCACLAIAQTKPASSRAIAAVTTVGGFPARTMPPAQSFLCLVWGSRCQAFLLASPVESIASIATGRINLGQGVEVEVGDSLQRLSCRRGAKAVGERVEPRNVFGLQGDQFIDGIAPALRSAASIGGPAVPDLGRGHLIVLARPVDLMSVFGPGNRVKGSKPRLCRGPTRGAAHWSVFCGGLSSFHSRTRGCRPEGVTRLATCMIEGRAGWFGVEPQAQETGRGTAYTIYRHGRA
jgi:hypothetical protein